MKRTAVILTVLTAVLAQVVLARYAAGGWLAFDFVLVGVVLAALQWGPVAGIFTGTTGGLLQDLFSGDVVGVGGLAKTLVGTAAGVIGTQFVLVRPHARMLIVALATVVHRGLVLALRALIEQDWPGIAVGAMLAEVGINATVAVLAFHVTSTLPDAVARQRATRRSSFGRGRW